jgi:Family of unknown function (DUF6488)
MKIFIRLFTLVFALKFSQSALAGAGEDCHFHGKKPAEQSTVLKCADLRIQKLIARGKIDASWKSIKHESITTIDGENGKEWKILFTNTASANKTKMNLYLFFSESGNFIAANHSGK